MISIYSTVYIKQGHRYPKEPDGCGAVGDPSELWPCVQEFLDDNNILPEYARKDSLIRWGEVKRTIVARQQRFIAITNQTGLHEC